MNGGAKAKAGHYTATSSVMMRFASPKPPESLCGVLRKLHPGEKTPGDGKKEGADCSQLLSYFLFEDANCQENTADLQGIKCTRKMPPRDGDTLTGSRLSRVLRQLNTSMCAMGPNREFVSYNDRVISNL